MNSKSLLIILTVFLPMSAFDLNQGWWEFVEDKAMSGEAQIIVGGYTKVIGNERIYLVRITEDGQYQIVSYIEPTLLVDGMVECDIEIATPDTHPFPGLTDQPIFREDQPDNTITWAEPDIVIL